MALQNLVTQIQALSGSAEDLHQLHSILKAADEPLHADPPRLSSLLDQLEPARHSLGYLYILEAFSSVSVPKEQANAMVLTIVRFINGCDGQQTRLAPDKFVTICRRLKDQVLLLEAPLRGVYPMLSALRKFPMSSEHLTSLHPEFLLLCLLSKSYKIGLSILDNDIYEVDQPRDLFLYCYYGGMICIGQKHFQKALELLRNVITAPMNAINPIVVEAYKKYILVSLIRNGQFSASLPKYASSAAQRSLKTFCQPYVELANTYGNGKVKELEAYVQANTEKFESIQDGEIFASINQKDGMVSFLEDPEQYKSNDMIEHIDSSIQRMMALWKKLASMDEVMSYDPQYLGKVGRERQKFDMDDFDAVPQKFTA